MRRRFKEVEGLEENKDYRVHRSGDLSEGYKLQVEHTVSCENTDISDRKSVV